MDSNGEFDADAAKIKSSCIYRFLVAHLQCPALEHDDVFRKLRQRLLSFHVVGEKYRLNGPSQDQLAAEHRSGVHFGF